MILKRWRDVNGLFLSFQICLMCIHRTIGSMMPQITNLDVKCGRTGMSVTLDFDRPFPGVIYSKGFYSDKSCHYITQENSGTASYLFMIPLKCGVMGPQGESIDKDMFFESTIMIQNDALIVEEWDIARKLKCTWRHTMQKSVSASPFKIQEPEKVSLNIDDKSLKTLMEIHKGRSTLSPATGYIHEGEEASLVIYIQEPTGKLDANAVSCKAESPTGEIVELVDEKGCVVKPSLMTEFVKTREVTGVVADLMLFSYLKGFQVGKSPEMTVSCQLEVCKGKCFSPCQKTSSSRVRRQSQYDQTTEEEYNENSLPSAVTDVRRSVIVVAKEQLPSLQKCGLEMVTTITISTLFGIIICLSLLTCFLAGKIKSLQQKTVLKV